MNNDKPLLEEAIFKFTQEANCLDGDREYEEIEIIMQSSLGVDRDFGSHFFTVKTDSWSLDSIDDLKSLFARIEKCLNTSSAPQKEDFMLK